MRPNDSIFSGLCVHESSLGSSSGGLGDRGEAHPEVSPAHHPGKAEFTEIQLNFLLLSHLELHVSCFISNIAQIPEAGSTMNIPKLFFLDRNSFLSLKLSFNRCPGS